MRRSFLLTSLLALSGCTLFDGPTVRAERSIEAAVWAFQTQRQRFPRDLDELQAFAAGRMSLDTGSLSQVYFDHPTPGVLRVEFHTDSASDAIESLTFRNGY
ncbi:MAG: hypothetical protein INR62_04735 [Rhodospirillales bacterium]|nr:hypothetical protein [Acetobacter sp.]